jgi:hypothetical protein
MVAPLVMASRTHFETLENFRARAFKLIEAHNAALVEVAPVEAPQVPAKGRCPHYAQIKEFFNVARELGFDTSKDSQDRWRGAIGMLLGRRIASRAELSGAEWGFATNALRMGRLFI